MEAETHALEVETTGGETPAPRGYHSLCTVRNRMLLFGGYDGTRWLDDLWLIDDGMRRVSYAVEGDCASLTGALQKTWSGSGWSR